jgi:DNA-binding LacI/PurR family transcriptional regulator
MAECGVGMERLRIGCVMSDIFFPMDDTQYIGHAWKCLHEAVLLQGHEVLTIALRVYDELGLRAQGGVPDDLDGYAFVAPQPDCPELFRTLRHGLPTVLIGSKLALPGSDCVDVDNRRVGQLAAEQFLKAGHERVAFVTTSPLQVSSMERHAGLKGGYLMAGKPPESVRYYGLNEFAPIEDATELEEDLAQDWKTIEYFGWHANPGVMDAFLHKLAEDRVTALLAFNDQDARMLTDHLIRSGRRVPSEVSVVGVDNVGRYVLGTPRLTSIGQNVPQICRVAVRLLLARIQNPSAEPQVILVQPSLHERGSVVPPLRSAA